MAMLKVPDSKTRTDKAVLKAVDRACADLRRGDPVVLIGPEKRAVLVQAAEGTTDELIAEFSELSGLKPRLLLTAQRVRALGLDALPTQGPDDGVLAFAIEGLNAERIAELADPTSGQDGAQQARALAPAAPSVWDAGAVDLVKLARLLPAALSAPLDIPPGSHFDARLWATGRGLRAVSTGEVAAYRHAAARTLVRVTESRLPLAGAEDTRVVAFRPHDGGIEHLALIIGQPDPGQAVLTRLHSECFTGDLLGSLRCDCGDQLRGAVTAIAEAGSGLVLYLAQEGRGIGLINKLRAYALQDLGADTLEANQQLGFDADERVYLPAAEMLRLLGFEKVKLLTNNPEKVAALTRCGILVEDRVPHSFPSNQHNEAYLGTKARRFGHLF
ncbi:MAG: GTP cyclohydrolase II [Pseudomonadota bacterium]